MKQSRAVEGSGAEFAVRRFFSAGFSVGGAHCNKRAEGTILSIYWGRKTLEQCHSYDTRNLMIVGLNVNRNSSANRRYWTTLVHISRLCDLTAWFPG